MKKLLLLLLAVCLLASVFAGCSAEANMHDPYYTRGYTNVSTTRNGTVNGTNDHRSTTYGSYAKGYDRRGLDTSSRTTRNTGTSARTTRQTGAAGTYGRIPAATGMTGGR